MTYALRWTESGRAQYDALKAEAKHSRASRMVRGKKKSTRSEGLFKQLLKALNHLQKNPKHPGLHSHEFDSLDHPYHKGEKVWESYIQNQTSGAYRLFWCYGKEVGELTILAITPHP